MSNNSSQGGSGGHGEEIMALLWIVVLLLLIAMAKMFGISRFPNQTRSLPNEAETVRSEEVDSCRV